MIIQMIVHAISAGMRSVLPVGQKTHISEIVFAQHHGYAVKTVPVFQSRRAAVAVIVIFHFLVNRQKHRHFVKIRVHVFLNQFLLFPDNILEYLNILRQRSWSLQRAVPLAAHADGNELFMPCAALQTVRPVIKKPFFVRVIIPFCPVRRILTLYLIPFFAGTHAGLVVRISDDHAVLIGQIHAGHSRSVQEKRGRPHGRPQIVSLHPEQKFKNVIVHFRIEPSEMAEGPGSEARPFIVDEESPEFYRRLMRDYRQTGNPAHCLTGIPGL